MAQPPPTRRDLLRAGAAVAGAAALGGCGSGPATVPSRSPAAPAADPVHVLDRVLVVEHTTLYGYGLAIPLLGPVTAPTATVFRQHHADHRDRLAQLIRGRGGAPTPARSSYDLGTPPADEGGAVSLVATLEEEAARAHYGALRQIEDPTLLQTLASIMGDEAQHAATLRTVLQQDPAPASLVSA